MTIVSTARATRRYPLAVLAVGVFVLATPPRCTYAGVLPGSNLIVNPGAESDTGNGGTPKVSPSGWINTTEADVLAYAQALGPGAPGPATPGNNLFGGGFDSSATLTQTIDVSVAASGIDVETIPYTLCGFLGGFASQEDNVVVTASFQTAGSTSTGQDASIGPVTAADRGFVSGTCLRSTSGIIPAGTRQVVITVTLTNNTPGGPFNDGYADNLNFLFSATCPEAVGIACMPPTTTTSSTTSSTSTSTTTTTATPTTTSTTSSTTTSTTSSSTTNTSSSTSSSTSTTTTRAPVTTTTTTLSGACPVGATFASIDCRLRALLADTSAATDLGSLQQNLVKTLTAARDRFEQLPSATKSRKAKTIIRFTERKLVSYARRIRSNKGRKTIPEATRTRLTDAAEPIRSDLLVLRGQQ